MLVMRKRAFAVALLLAPVAAAQIAAPVEEAVCNQPEAAKAVASEQYSKWPNGAIKWKSIKFADKTSVSMQFRADGTKELETHLDAGGRNDGTEKRWQANGQLFVCAVYEAGKKQGTWIYHDKDGTPLSAFTFKDDQEVEHLTYSPRFGWQRFNRN